MEFRTSFGFTRAWQISDVGGIIVPFHQYYYLSEYILMHFFSTVYYDCILCFTLLLSFTCVAREMRLQQLFKAISMPFVKI